MLGQKQFAINPHPEAVIGIGEKCPDLTHLDLARSAIVLSSRSGGLFRSLLVSAFIQNQGATSVEVAMLLASLKLGYFSISWRSIEWPPKCDIVELLNQGENY